MTILNKSNLTIKRKLDFKSFTAIFLVVVAAMSVATGSFIALYRIELENSELSKNLFNLEREYDALQTQYYALLGNFSALGYDYQTLLLERPIPNPGSGPPETEQMLFRYQALQQMYMKLQAEYSQLIADYGKLKGTTNLRLMQEDLRPLTTPEDPAVVNLVRNITGKIGNATDPNSYWKDIKAMYDWVAANIKYREDGLYPKLPDNPADALADQLKHSDQMAQFANETLSLRQGDCDDMAILLTSMIRAYFSKQFLVENVWITGATAGDVAVVIPFSNEKIVILNPTRGYYSHDTLGSISPNEMSAEIYNWLAVWRPSLGNDVHVYRVFSDYMDRSFDTTEEYINWMYNR